jgi:ribonuclease E
VIRPAGPPEDEGGAQPDPGGRGAAGPAGPAAAQAGNPAPATAGGAGSATARDAGSATAGGAGRATAGGAGSATAGVPFAIGQAAARVPAATARSQSGPAAARAAPATPAAEAADPGDAPPKRRRPARSPAATPAFSPAAADAPASVTAGPAQEFHPPPPIPAATFQPPLVIFQPPDISEVGAPAGTGRARHQAGAGAEARGGSASGGGPAADAQHGAGWPDDGNGQPPARRRSRSRGKPGAGEESAGDPAEDGASGQGHAGQGHAGQGHAGQGWTDDEASGAGDQDGDGESGGTSGRRRRRGGRGHAKARGQGEDGAEAGAAAAAPGQDDEHDQGGGRAVADGLDGDGGDGGDGPTTPARRRRRRQRGGSAAEPDIAPDDPPDTVVHVRAPRAAAAADLGDVRSVKGSTRLEAKRQRRREGRDSGRRRPPIITESEFLARREAVERVMVVRQHGERTQIAVLEDGVLVEHYVDKASHQSYVGNVYLGKVQNVLPSMEAAFVDIGKGRNAVLYAGEVNFDASGLEGVAKRIESALKSGQSILVQVTKDPIGHKGARLTSQVSLPGRYLVYVPGASMTGISRKLPDTERTRLKQILKQVMPEDAGVIVRTAAEGASEEELAHDVARLSAQWEAIERRAKTATAPELLYSEPDLTLRVVRDIFNEDFTKLVIASDSDWDMVDEYVRYVAPNLADRMERWTDGDDVFAAYRLDEQLAKALDRKVWLPSGGSLVIDGTEAMTVIDVNTGKFTGQGGNLEQTVTRNNLEAAEEIVRQLRLRDVGGMIVIDFIDMVLESNRDLVLRRLIECLARDRTKHQVAEVTSLGLVQMTRKRVGSGLLEAFSVPCEHCNGRGVIVSLELVDHVPPRGRAAGDDRQVSQDRKPKDGRSSRGGRRGGSSGGGPGGSRAGDPGADDDRKAKETGPRAGTAQAGIAHVGSALAATAQAGPAQSAAADGVTGDSTTGDSMTGGGVVTAEGAHAETGVTAPAGTGLAETQSAGTSEAGGAQAAALVGTAHVGTVRVGAVQGGPLAPRTRPARTRAAAGQPETAGQPGADSQPGRAGQPEMVGQPGADSQPGRAGQPGADGQPGEAAAGAVPASRGRRARGRAGQKAQATESGGSGAESGGGGAKSSGAAEPVAESVAGPVAGPGGEPGADPGGQADPGRHDDEPEAQPAVI